MSSDLIAAIVGLVLGLSVIIVGFRRKLGNVTQSWLPQFEKESSPTSAALGLYEGGQERRQPSQRQKRLAVGLYFLLSILNAVRAIVEVDDRLLHASLAALFAVGAVVYILKDRG